MVTHKEVLDIVFYSRVANPFHALETKVKELEKRIEELEK